MVFFKNLRKAVVALAFVVGMPATFGVTSLALATQAEAATLTSIQVRGNDRIDAATIRSYVTVPIGSNFTQSDVNDTLLALFATGLFADVVAEGSGGTIIITVTENPVVVQVGFVGNDKVKDSDLVDLVMTASRGVVSNVIIANDVRRIQDRYEAVGRSAVIQVDIQPVGPGLANVIFNITEGERLKVATVNFVGNNAYSTRQLSSVIDLRESGLFSWLTKNDIYSPDATARDSELLRQHYLSNGYADFQVLSTTADFDAATNSYVVTYNLSEGPLYRFGAIGVDSTIPGVDASILGRDIRTRQGGVFNATDIERTLENISVRLAGMGYPFARVTPRGNRDYSANTIDITYVIDDGARAYVERIDIVGNDRTRDYVIRREFGFAEGDAYNRVLVDRVERRLRNLGIFDGVAIIEQRGSAADQVVLVVMVEERRTGQVSATAGYSTADGVLGEVSLEEANFLGRGQYLRVAFSIGRSSRNYSVSFTEPYFLGRHLPIGFDVFRREAQATASRPFSQTQTGGAVRLGIPLTDRLTAQLSYRLVTDTITADPDYTLPPFYTEGTTVTSSVAYGFTFSTVDNINDPRRGIYMRLNQEFAGVGGNNSFLRTTGDLRLYQPLGYDSPLVAAFRLQGGTIMGINQDVRLADHFNLGGDSIRGFANNGIGPRTDDPAGLALGGRNFWTATAEIRFPIPFLPEDAGFSAAVFADAGMLWGVDGPLPGPTPYFDGNILRSSVGASLVWASPFGQLRVDFAKVLSAAPWDQQQAIRLGIGGQF